MKDRKIYCAKCGFQFSNEAESRDTIKNQKTPCPKCDSIERQINLFLEDEIQINDDTSINLSTRKPTGGKKTLLTGKYGSELHHDSNTWQERKRTIDIANNNYQKQFLIQRQDITKMSRLTYLIIKIMVAQKRRRKKKSESKSWRVPLTRHDAYPQRQII